MLLSKSELGGDPISYTKPNHTYFFVSPDVKQLMGQCLQGGSRTVAGINIVVDRGRKIDSRVNSIGGLVGDGRQVTPEPG